jgi:tellurite resistance protein
VDALFAVAAADGGVSNDEIEEIRGISNSLKLTHKEFIDAKLRIPREIRES